MVDWLGWAATAVFLASYGCKDQRRLRIVQAGAALLWAIYGAIIAATPIVVANLLVAAAAVYSSLNRSRSQERLDGSAGTIVTPGSELDLSGTS
jgi:membrane protein implicated in regulation of membrane protease activity